MVYTSSTLSLAALETFVHLAERSAPDEFLAMAGDVPAEVGIESIRASDLPANWRSYVAPSALADIGATWVRQARTAVLAVPSAIVPQELNYLLNPAHRDFRRIRVGKPEPFRFDERMGKAR